jgi:hypothetical protein
MDENRYERPELIRKHALPESEDPWSVGTTQDDCRSWVCGFDTVYRRCRIICRRCGSMRDCSDPCMCRILENASKASEHVEIDPHRRCLEVEMGRPCK